MATSKKAARLESEIEKSRAECNWEKILDISKQAKTKSPNLEVLLNVALGEAELETFVIKYPPKTQDHVAKAKRELRSAKQHLQNALKGNNKHYLYKEAQLLMAKYHFACGEYKEALNMYDTLGLDTLDVQDTSNRMLRMMAEAFGLKGICLERTISERKDTSNTADEEDIIYNYEKGGDLALHYLQELEKVGCVGGNLTGMGPVLETVVQRAPILHLSKGDKNRGINRFRQILKAVEARSSQDIRVTLARELVEVLLRGICNSTYTAPVVDNEGGTLSRSVGLTVQPGMRHSLSRQSLKPKMYSTDSIFVPKNRNEEVLLLLLICELQVSKDVVLNRSPEYAGGRNESVLNIEAIYDLLSISLVKMSQFSLLSETFDRSMKFSSEEFHLWYQFALSLTCAGKFARALLVLEECHRLQPKNSSVLMMAAKICFKHLAQIDDGIEFCKKVISLQSKQLFTARAYMMLGIGEAMKAGEATLNKERQQHQMQSLEALKKAEHLDKHDHLIAFHYALQLAYSRQIPEALEKIRTALKLCSDHAESLHLLALLLSSQKLFNDALKVIKGAIEQYPDNMSMLFTMIKLVAIVRGPDEALMTCKSMLSMWKKTHDKIMHSDTFQGMVLIEKVGSDKRSMAHVHISELKDRDSGSIHNSLAASRVEQALSEVASSMGSYIPKPGSQQVWYTQAQIWLSTAEIYIAVGKLNEAKSCMQEAASIFPLSHQILHMWGCIHDHKGELTDAKKYYDNALAINPSYVKSLQNLGMLYLEQQNYTMAEKLLKDAVNIDPTSHVSWNHLGRILMSQGEYETASEYLMTSLELESTAPIVPFMVISRIL
ncbi:tetratricopeptide repeat protein 7B-like isoform X2 [Anneissia japonica]|uniref:tetratricopeptide repeat protein 7B-like isoform X2 n=1 Tax=Anneissia japonica TaxID=1529436 RepID=UPI0014258992|nr:tetratricopeptide repeat protein 7B-like isoform X2 [Anneissia japonica]